ncbi:unnamed protein product [Haemonchus placei]|uniref:Uncharacterized protein n=1 Tax=Haemonchus placei TaxID=6290 RepID=A0A0N4W8B4_HAEPC|nr:unnamed protein product [Haemonchus placei]
MTAAERKREFELREECRDRNKQLKGRVGWCTVVRLGELTNSQKRGGRERPKLSRSTPRYAMFSFQFKKLE